MKRSHGSYNKQSRNFTSKGRMTVNAMLTKYKEGDRVQIKANPRFKEGQPHLRFNHLEGIVKGIQGEGIIVEIKDGNKPKQLIVRTMHLKKVA